MGRLSDYDYQLPKELIAQRPIPDRSASRLLVLDKGSGAIQHRRFLDCIDLLKAGDVLVVNDTRVTALRLLGHRTSGGAVELLLLRELGDGEFVALAKPGRRLRSGAEFQFEGDLTGRIVEELADGQKRISFADQEGWRQRLLDIGETPLPPYIHERLEERERYQTVYASTGGSAAAPTAGLHFTSQIIETLEQKGVRFAKVTLDVGLDTFRPVQSEILDEHQMHGELCSISEEAAETINEAKGRVIAVGTTSVRTLETFAVSRGSVVAGSRESKLFIRPGFKFRIVDGMFTNFHLPRTTMLMMISAMAGRDSIFRAYAEAIEEHYRFLSFGDSMLIF